MHSSVFIQTGKDWRVSWLRFSPVLTNLFVDVNGEKYEGSGSEQNDFKVGKQLVNISKHNRPSEMAFPAAIATVLGGDVEHFYCTTFFSRNVWGGLSARPYEVTVS